MIYTFQQSGERPADARAGTVPMIVLSRHCVEGVVSIHINTPRVWGGDTPLWGDGSDSPGGVWQAGQAAPTRWRVTVRLP